MELLNRAMKLAYFATLGDLDKANGEADLIQRVSKQDISRMAQNILKESNSSVVYYQSMEQ